MSGGPAAAPSGASSLYVLPNVPSCSAHISRQSYSQQGSTEYDVREWSYFKDKVGIVLPGLIVGGVCLLLCLLFSVWLLSLCCRPNRKWVKPNATASKGGPRWSWQGALQVALLVSNLALLAVATWALIDSIHATDGVVASFWNQIDTAQLQVRDISQTATNLVNGLDGLRSTLGVVSRDLPGLATALPSGVSVSQAQTQVGALSSRLAAAVASGRSAVDNINQNGVAALATLERDARGRSEDLQDTWRIVVLVVLYAAVVLLASLAALLAAARRLPRLAAASTVLLWLLCGLLFIFFTGGIYGAFGVAKDSCLYAEDFSLRLAAQRAAPADRDRVLAALRYYYGALPVPDADVAADIYGLDTRALAAALATPGPAAVLALLRSTAGQLVINGSSVSAADRGAVLGLPAQVDALTAGVAALQAKVLRAQFVGLYDGAKAILCCRLTGLTHRVWLAWTITAALCTLVAVLATAKIMSLLVPREQPYARDSDSAARPQAGRPRAPAPATLPSGTMAYSNGLYAAAGPPREAQLAAAV